MSVSRHVLDVSASSGSSALNRLGTKFRAGQMQMRYTCAVRMEAIWLGRGCSYEEVQYAEFPRMAIQWGAGRYSAGVGGVIRVMGSKLATVAVRILGENWTRSVLVIESGWR